jgi:hypothetical protein
MDRAELGKAAKLLAKAEVTTFEFEATALAERAYRMVADVLNAAEEEQERRGIVPRRDRRRLHDRRTGRRGERNALRREPRTDVATTYGLRSRRSNPTGAPPPGSIDLTA